MVKKATVSKRRAASRRKKGATVATVLAWQDDPSSGKPAIARPVPVLAKAPLKYKFNGAAVAPGAYALGTWEFRYWTAAEALRRGGDFWAPLLGGKHWQPGTVLPVSLDKGVDLNAYYDRTELAFFHQSVGGKTIYSGESPDVVCHEMGHACLDAHRPELFDAPFIEVGAFHESFGDMSAVLSALQLQGVRQAALGAVKSYKASFLSRCAEQLGWAIRQVDAPAVDKDCLRNAYNAFKYVDPQTLPDDAPATKLCAEVHSFSRVFTGAFYEILSGMLKIRSANPTEAALAAIAKDFAQLLMDATAAAPVQPNYFSQVAAHMIDADTARFSGKYRSALVNTFVDRLIVPESAVHALTAHKGKVPAKRAVRTAGLALRPAKPRVHKIPMNAREFGHGNKPFVVLAPLDQKPFQLAAAGLANRHAGPDSVAHATHRFVKMLFARDRVDTGPGAKKHVASIHASRQKLRKTHVLVPSKDGLTLTRRLFHCGCEVERAD
jgi:hypothetical protein